MQQNMPGYGRKRIKRKLRWRRLIVLITIFALLIFGIVKTYQLISYLFFTPREITKTTLPHGKNYDENLINKNINLLIFGLDGADKEGLREAKRTDALLLISFDTKDKKVSAISIPRDTIVKIPQREAMDKINHAYFYGGELLVKQTMANFLNIPIHNFVALDAQSFMQIIDILGGIGIYVENDMNYEDPYQNLIIHIKKGYQKLTGEQALKYIRYRSDELGDIGRVLRQQKFLKAFSEQLFSLNGLTKLPYLKTVAQQMIQTDVEMPQAIKMIMAFRSYDRQSITFEMLPGDFATIQDVSYWQTQPDEIRTTLDRLGIYHLK